MPSPGKVGFGSALGVACAFLISWLALLVPLRRISDPPPPNRKIAAAIRGLLAPARADSRQAVCLGHGEWPWAFPIPYRYGDGRAGADFAGVGG